MASLTIRGLRAEVIDLSRLSVVMEAVGSSWTGLVNMPGCESKPGRKLVFCFDLTLYITTITGTFQPAGVLLRRPLRAPKWVWTQRGKWLMD